MAKITIASLQNELEAKSQVIADQETQINELSEQLRVTKASLVTAQSQSETLGKQTTWLEKIHNILTGVENDLLDVKNKVDPVYDKLNNIGNAIGKKEKQGFSWSKKHPWQAAVIFLALAALVLGFIIYQKDQKIHRLEAVQSAESVNAGAENLDTAAFVPVPIPKPDTAAIHQHFQSAKRK